MDLVRVYVEASLVHHVIKIFQLWDTEKAFFWVDAKLGFLQDLEHFVHGDQMFLKTTESFGGFM